MENPSFNAAPSVPGTDVPVDNNWDKYADELNAAGAEFNNNANEVAPDENAPTTEVIDEADKAIEQAAETVDKVIDAVETAETTETAETEPARVTGINKDDETGFVAKVTETNKDEEVIARVTGTNKDDEPTTEATNADRSEGQKILDAISGEEETPTEPTPNPEKNELHEATSDSNVIKQEFYHLTNELITHDSPEEKATPHYNEIKQQQAVLFEAGILMNYSKDGEPESADEKPSAEAAFNTIAQRYFNISDAYRKYSDELTRKEPTLPPHDEYKGYNLQELSKIYDKQSELAAWRASIALEYANTRMGELRQRYASEFKANDVQEEPNSVDDASAPETSAEVIEAIA